MRIVVAAIFCSLALAPLAFLAGGSCSIASSNSWEGPACHVETLTAAPITDLSDKTALPTVVVFVMVLVVAVVVRHIAPKTDARYAFWVHFMHPLLPRGSPASLVFVPVLSASRDA